MALRKKKGDYIRRVVGVEEVVSYDRYNDKLFTNLVFKWNPTKDDFEILRSVLLYKLGFDEETLKKDIDRKIKLLGNAVKKDLDAEKALFR